MPHHSAPLAVLEPSRIWHTRAAIFAGLVTALVLVAGFWFPYVLLLAPVMGYQLLYSLRFLEPGRVGVTLYEDGIVIRYPFRKRARLEKANIICFAPVFRGPTEIVVARMTPVDPRGADGQKLAHKTDVPLPSGLMRNVGLVGQLESWRTGSFRTDSLMPPGL